jgi:hypothetical protein
VSLEPLSRAHSWSLACPSAPVRWLEWGCWSMEREGIAGASSEELTQVTKSEDSALIMQQGWRPLSWVKVKSRHLTWSRTPYSPLGRD